MIATYDTDRYDFRGPVVDAIGDPTSLVWDGGDHVTDADQGTPWHAALYRLYEDTDWLDRWRRFACEWIRPRFGPGRAVQARPTWRVHPAGNHRVGPQHRDTRYGHGVGTTNLWVPLADTNPTNSLHIDGEPIRVRYGEVLVFDGARRLHGNVANTSAASRVSFDARVVPLRVLQGGGVSVNTRTPLEVGDYYAELDAWTAEGSSVGSMPHLSANSIRSFSD